MKFVSILYLALLDLWTVWDNFQIFQRKYELNYQLWNDRPSPLWRDHRFHGDNLIKMVSQDLPISTFSIGSSRVYAFKGGTPKVKICHWYSRPRRILMELSDPAENSSRIFSPKKGVAGCRKNRKSRASFAVATQFYTSRESFHTDSSLFGFIMRVESTKCCETPMP